MANAKIHFSDGTKAVCNAKDGTAVTDEQKVTCRKCQTVLANKAEGAGDPLVKVKIKNMDLNDGVDYAFSFGVDPQNPKVMKTYHIINNVPCFLPRSVVEHLRNKGYPFKRYAPGQEPGMSMQVAGTYERFVINELGDKL